MPSPAYEAAVALLHDGTPPDGGEWHGGVPKITMDFTSPKTVREKKKTNPDGSVTFAVEFLFGELNGGGAHLDTKGQLLVQRYLKVYPMGETALVQVFMGMVERQKAQLKGDLMDWFKTQTWKPFSAIVGWQDQEEWEDIKLASFGQVELHDPRDGILGRFGRLSMAVRVTAAIRAKRKAAITDAPFSSMSDQELNSLIAKWEHEAPENFWMDGELRATRAQAYAMYRAEWRKKSPREQTRLLQDLQQGRMAARLMAAKVAARYLSAGDMSAPLDVGTAKGSKAWIALLRGYILVEEAGSPKREAVMGEAVKEVQYAAWLFRNKAVGKWLKEEAKKLGNLIDTVD